MEKFGKWENIKQEEKKRGKFPTKRGLEGEIAKGIWAGNIAPNTFSWEPASSHCLSDGAVKCSNNLTSYMNPEVNVSGILNFINAHTTEEAILLDDLRAVQKGCEH